MIIAVLLTVYNRREVTLQGLRSLYKSIDYLGGGRQFDVYMTDDGCTDGTGDAVRKEFPEVHIIQGDGNLYWSGGMRKAWQTAIDSGVNYDFYLWFNDDADLYNDALVAMFSSMNQVDGNCIISGAFCDKERNVSYGGWNNNVLVTPNGSIQVVEKINGNLVIVPKEVVREIGILDSHFVHSYGDWEYGIRARKAGMNLYITNRYVGVCDRHDSLRKCFNPSVNVIGRLKDLYSPTGIYPPNLWYYYKCFSFILAIRRFCSVHIRTLLPFLFNN